MAAAQLLQDDWGVSADVWSCTSFTELAREGAAVVRHNLLNPTAKAQVPYVALQLDKSAGPHHCLD